MAQEKQHAPGDFFVLDNVVVDGGFLRQMTGAETKVYLAMRFHRNRKSGETWPGLEKLAEETGLNEGTVSRAQRRLAKLGLTRRVGEATRSKVARWGFPSGDAVPGVDDLRQRNPSGIGCASATDAEPGSVALAPPMGCAGAQNDLPGAR